MTSILSPAARVVQQHGDLFRQMGATNVAMTETDEVTVTFHDNTRGTNAAALLKDTFQGAKLLVRNDSVTADFVTPSAQGMARLFAKVPGVQPSVVEPEEGTQQLNLAASTAKLGSTLIELVRMNPVRGVSVLVLHGRD